MDKADSVSRPRGGPVFVRGRTSDLTSTSDFGSAVLQELEELTDLLKPDPTLSHEEEDISLDDLKIFRDSELFSEGMKAYEEARNSSPVEGNHSSYKPREPLSQSYDEKMTHLAGIRKKQEEDRAAAAATLHSLAAHQKSKKCAPSSSQDRKLKSLRSSSHATAMIKPSDSAEFVAIRNPQVLLCIVVYDANMHNPQEILVLEQQKLTEFRDVIHCITDKIMKKADKHDPSGYFLIEDVFYDDMRDPSAIDISAPILDWFKNSKEEALARWESILYGDVKKTEILGDKNTPDLPDFQVAKMEDTRFCDLKLRVGCEYIYCHQGDCKHRLLVRDMRLVHPEDPQNRLLYPMVVYRRKTIVQKCSLCQVAKAEYMTSDDKGTEENPAFWCKGCYWLIHYDDKGQLRYDGFTSHEYVQDT